MKSTSCQVRRQSIVSPIDYHLPNNENFAVKSMIISRLVSSFGAPVLFAKKPDGSLRLCLDYRALNAVTVKDKTPVPHSDDLINHTAGSTIFTKLDLRSAFHQLLIRPSDIPKSAITTIFGNYEWLVMPFDMANSPSSWQAIVNSIFCDLLGDYVVVYLDDILIYSKTRESHIHHVTEVLERLQKHQLYVKLSKSIFFTNRVEFLGHILTPDGLSPSPTKCSTVLNWPRPQSKNIFANFSASLAFIAVTFQISLLLPYH